MTQTSPIEFPILALPSRSHCSPASVATAPANVRGERANRLMVIFRSPGCAYDLRAGGGCTYCGFRHLTTHGVPVTAAEYVAQFEHALQRRGNEMAGIREIDLFNSGNFLNDREVPEEARTQILRRCAGESGLRLVVLESRPEYVTVSKLEALQAVVRPHGKLALEVAIGLDAFDDHLRERVLRKGFTLPAFERAVKHLGKTGTDLMVYVLLKPWAMTEEAALTDVERAAEYVHDVARRYDIRARIGLEPTFVVPETHLAVEFREGRYQPPSLSLVLETARRIAHFGALTIGMWDEGLNPIAVPSACAADTPRILNAMRLFNLTQNAASLTWN